MLKDIICFKGTMPYVEKSDLYFDRLPEGLINKTLLLAADFHFGGMMNDRRMKRIIDAMKALNPDIITLAGDNADDYKNEFKFIKDHMSKLSAPLGIYCVPGNNDWEAVNGRYDELRHMITQAGVKFIVNEHVSINVTGGRLVVSGIDDCKCGSPNKRGLIYDYRQNDFNILLCHSPAILDRMLTGVDAKFQLVLCGHTHAGQIRIGKLSPYTIGFESSRKRKRRYFFVNGEHDVDGMKIIVSNGIGCSILPIRVGAPPKINFFTLKVRS